MAIAKYKKAELTRGSETLTCEDVGVVIVKLPSQASKALVKKHNNYELGQGNKRPLQAWEPDSVLHVIM